MSPATLFALGLTAWLVGGFALGVLIGRALGREAERADRERWESAGAFLFEERDS